ncbi:Hypothetical protein PBC10988_35810 [Planctomycetales bacterium 10988]|nr:Hypothetical protein PBC10988_35810 [Planctomycetales bacterium 10988]
MYQRMLGLTTIVALALGTLVTLYGQDGVPAPDSSKAEKQKVPASVMSDGSALAQVQSNPTYRTQQPYYTPPQPQAESSEGTSRRLPSYRSAYPSTTPQSGQAPTGQPSAYRSQIGETPSTPTGGPTVDERYRPPAGTMPTTERLPAQGSRYPATEATSPYTRRAPERIGARYADTSEGPAGELPNPQEETTAEPPQETEVTPTIEVEESQPVNSVPPADSKTVLREIEMPVLVVTSTGPEEIVMKKEANFEIAISNRGQVDAENVHATITLPDWAELIFARPSLPSQVSQFPESNEPISWKIDRLPAGKSQNLTLRLIPKSGEPMLMNIEVTSAPTVASTEINVLEPKLAMEIEGSDEALYGRLQVYRLNLSNPGTADAEEVLLKLYPTTPGENAPATHRLGTLRAGEKKVIELELTPRQGGTLKIKSEAFANGGLSAQAEQSVLVRKPALKIAVDGPKFRYAGSSGTYRATVANPGNASARNIQVIALVPPGASFVSCSEGGRYEEELGKVTWRFTDLPPEGEQEVSWRCELNEPGVTRAQAACAADGDLRDSAAGITEVEAIADLLFTVSDPRGPIPVGEQVDYEIRLANRGTKAAENIQINAFLSAGLNPIAAAGGPKFSLHRGQVTFEPIASLGPGQEVTLQISAVATGSGNLVFRAELRCEALDLSIAEEESTRFYSDELKSETSEDKEKTPATTRSRYGRIGLQG